MSDDKKTQSSGREIHDDEHVDQSREAPPAPLDESVNDNGEAWSIGAQTKEAVKRTISRDDYAKAGKEIEQVVDKGKEIAEQLNAQERLNALVIKIKTEYGPRLNSIDNRWKKVPRAVQSYIVHTGPVAALPAMVFLPGGMPAAVACAATSFLVKTGLLSFKGEIKEGKIDLNKSITIGDGLKKLTKLVIKGLQYFFEDLQGMEDVLNPAIEGAQYGDKMCATAKENLYNHLNKTGTEKLETIPGIYGKKAA